MKRAFTLVEMVTVLAIIGIGAALLYAIFFLNLASFEKQLSLIDLQMDADKIIEILSFDCKRANTVDVSADGKQVDFAFPEPGTNPPVSYLFTDAPSPGILRRISGVDSVISQNIDYANSSFSRQGDSLTIDLLLEDNVFRRGMTVRVETLILPRNL